MSLIYLRSGSRYDVLTVFVRLISVGTLYVDDLAAKRLQRLFYDGTAFSHLAQAFLFVVPDHGGAFRTRIFDDDADLSFLSRNLWYVSSA